MKKIIFKNLAIILIFTFIISLAFPQMAEAKSKAKKKYYTELMLDYKKVKIRVPDKDFLTDGINYSLHYQSDKDRWAVQTSLFTRREDAENLDFQPAEKFGKSKIYKLGKAYQMDYRLKGLSYEITFTFTKKHKKFFEKLTAKDFIVEKDKSEETYKEIVKDLLLSGVPSAYIVKNILPLVKLPEQQGGEKLNKVKELIPTYSLKEGYLKSSSEAIKRQKAGILLADTLNGEDVKTSVIRQLYLYKASDFEMKNVEMDEEAALLTFKKGEDEIEVFLVYDGKKTNKDSGKLMPGTDKTTVYRLKKK